jgi:hypothetical protein
MLQADTYRRMKKATRNRWQGHCPTTNCLWMHYLADVILNLKQFPMTAKQKKGLRDFRLDNACIDQVMVAVPCQFEGNACSMQEARGLMLSAICMRPWSACVSRSTCCRSLPGAFKHVFRTG